MTRLLRLITITTATLTLLISATVALAANGAQAPAAHHADASARTTREAFAAEMRKLWEDHITWTRLFIVSDATLTDPLPDLGPTTQRLLDNQVDIGNAIAAFYGRDAGDQLTALLKEHILGAAALLNTAKAGQDTTAASEAWYANANEIADFLHAANPKNWGQAEMRDMMKAHLDLTLEEAVARLTGHYQADIAAYDKVHAEILQMADMLSSGIVAQFPQAFAR
jgi:hypothetical protein